MNIDSKQRIHLAIALGAIVAVVLGYSAFGKSDDVSQTSANAAQGNFNGQSQMPQGDNGASGATGAMGGPPGQNGQNGQNGQGGPGGPGGQRPQQVTGSNATKAKAAAEDEVDGTAEVVMKSRSGSGYAVIVRTDDGPVMVELDKNFKVTDKHELQGPPGQAGQSGQPPAIQGGAVQ